MKKALWLLVMVVCSVVNAATVQQLLEMKNIQISIGEIENSTNNDIQIVKESTNEVLVTIPAHQEVEWDYQVAIIKSTGLSSASRIMISDNFIIRGWNSLGDGIQMKFFVRVEAWNNNIDLVKVSLMPASPDDFDVQFVKTSEKRGGYYNHYSIDIEFDDNFDESEIEIKVVEGFEAAR